MIINSQNLKSVQDGFKTVFNDAFGAAPSHFAEVSMRAPSSTSEEVYGWLGQFPMLRKWIGDRIVKNLTTHGYRIKNEKFETTVEVGRDNIEDDQIGLYKPMFSEMGRMAKVHPDTVLFALLKLGFVTPSYDGQNFFDADHPQVKDDGREESVSNMQAGTEPSWFLLDTSREVRPLIWQERSPYEFQAVDNPDQDTRVFMTDNYYYGVRTRCNAGFGLWQLAFGSKASLTPQNYAAARADMQNFRGDGDQLLGIKPTVLVVPPSLETDALTLLKADEIDGTSNIWKDSCSLIVTPYVA